MTLFHFSDDPAIGCFTPRRVRVPPMRPPGSAWLNGPLVWAIDDWHQAMYLFPRDCPRILIWPTTGTTAQDRERYWGTGDMRMIAFVETGWVARLCAGTIHRYRLPAETFVSLQDAGMWVSRDGVLPIDMETIADMPAALRLQRVELRPVDTLLGLKALWRTSLHVSGIRLRNAEGWT